MLPCVRGIALGCEVINLSNFLETAASHISSKLLAQTARAGLEGVCDAGEADVWVFGADPLNAGVALLTVRHKDGQRGIASIATVDAAETTGDAADGVPPVSFPTALTAALAHQTYAFGGVPQPKCVTLPALYREFALAAIMVIALAPLMDDKPRLRERAILAWVLLQTATLRGGNILIARATFVVAFPVLSTVHICLSSSDGTSGVRAASCIQMRGGHGRWLIRPRV